jgi:hypothetical protein
MKTIFKIAAASLLLCGVALASAASAGPAAPKAAGVHQSVVQDVVYRRGLRGRGWYGPRPYRYRGYYGRRWYGPGVGIYAYGGGGCRAACAARWGWGGPGFRRCVWRRC